MAKQGQHDNDAHNKDVSHGSNTHEKTVTTKPGTYKKRETYKQNAIHHRSNEDELQGTVDERGRWHEDTRDKPTIEGSTRARDSSLRSGRSGSDSNASRRSRGY